MWGQTTTVTIITLATIVYSIKGDYPNVKINAKGTSGDGSDYDDSGNEEEQPSLPISTVVMPSGVKTTITDAAPLKHDCGEVTKFIRLYPQGRMGKREYDLVAHEMLATKADLQEHSRYEIVKVEKVLNNCVWRRFETFQKQLQKKNQTDEVRMLFHDVRYLTHALVNGFNDSHKVDGMFGRALYFAEHSSTSHWYGEPFYAAQPSLDRVMLLCRVLLGKMATLRSEMELQSPPPGYHSVRGAPAPGGLRFPEYAIYDGAQVYPEYLITYKVTLYQAPPDYQTRPQMHRPSQRERKHGHKSRNETRARHD